MLDRTVATASLFALLLAATAQAQTPPAQTPPAPAPTAPAPTAPAPTAVPPAPVAPAPQPATVVTETAQVDTRRDFLMEANFRFRYLSVPDSVMDIWYFDSDDQGANPLKRPKVRAYAVGGEWIIKPEPENWIFYFEWIGNWMQGGYWDDVEDEPAEHEDGDWVEPNGFGVIALGANYAHEIHTREWLSFLFGGGIGMGFVTGDLTQWNPGGNEDNVDMDCLVTAAAYQRRWQCGDDGAKPVPSVVPILDITGSVRFHFVDNASIRIDGGFHDMFYLGTSVGAVF